MMASLVAATVAASEPRFYVAQRLSGAFGPLDGDLGKPAWSKAPWSTDFGDIRGEEDAPAGSQPPPGCRTRFKMLWDDSHLYVGAELEYDGPFSIAASFTERNAPIYQRDSDIELFVDARGSCHCYRELELNALNTVWNLLLDKPYMDGGSEHSGRVAKRGKPLYWDVSEQRTAVRLVRGRVGDVRAPAAWSAEIAISHNETVGCPAGLCSGGDAPQPPPPPPRVGDVWRINLSRVERRGDVNWVWSPQRAWFPDKGRWAGVVDMHRPEAWGALHFADESGRLPDRPGVPHWPLRAAGAMLYYAQRAFRDGAGKGSYARSVAELEGAGLVQTQLLDGLDVQLLPRVAGGYVARLRARGRPGGGPSPCLLVQDDRLLAMSDSSGA